MLLGSISALALLGNTAFAAADLTTSITAPSGVYVEQTGRYTVRVNNIGNQTSASSTLTIQLPVTNTSPQVYVMGTLGSTSSNCTRSGTRLTCSIASIRKNASASVYFDIAMPESVNPLVITASVSTSGAENSTSNNSASHTASLLNYAVSSPAGLELTHRHCTGTNLSSFYECELFPSSISEHFATLNSDGTISFPEEYGGVYTGFWWSDSADHLAFEYYESEVLVAEFEGYGVNGSCWEGLTTFPGSTYVSMYEVCQ